MSYSAQLAAQIRAANPTSDRVNASLRAQAYRALAKSKGAAALAQTSIDRDASKILALPDSTRSELSGKTYTTSSAKGGGRQTDSTEIEMSNMFD